MDEDAPTGVVSTPLGVAEAVVFGELAAKAGLDDEHLAYAQANCEVSLLVSVKFPNLL